MSFNMIQEITGGDLFRIEAVNAYPEDYAETTEVAKQELRADARPELTGHLENMDSYDVIFLGYPNWWGTMPMPVFTFLEEYDFSGKTIVPSMSLAPSHLLAFAAYYIHASLTSACIFMRHSLQICRKLAN